MEEILASIKRIIAEDGEAAVQRSARFRRGPVAVPDPEPEDDAEESFASLRPAEPEPAVAEPIEPEPVAEVSPPAAEPIAADDDDDDVLELTSPLPDPYYEDHRMAAAFDPPAHAAASDPILSGAAANASRSAFAALNQLQVRADAGQENTLEGLVSDLLRPMLRDWLDRELPGIVERLVAAEIQRVSGRG